MAMILDAFMSKFSTLLTDFVQDEVIMLLGVKDELQMLRKRMRSIQCLLKDAEKKKFNESSSTELWLSELKDVMYDAEDIIDLCRIEGTQLLTDQNPKSKSSSVYCAPTLKMLEVQECGALACMEKLDSLQKLYFSDTFKANLPEWILKTLQQRALQNDYNDDFQLELECNFQVIRGCLKGGSYWDLIEPIPQVKIFSDRDYLRYSKHPYVYDTNL